MALSGTFYGSTNNVMITPKIVWSAKQDVSGNYSTVTATLYYSRTNTGYETWGTGDFSITINGNKKSVETVISITYESNTWTMSHTVTVPHNADGTKSITISATGGIPGTSFSDTYISSKVTLNTIPRSSSITSAANTTLGDACNVKWTPAAKTFSYKLKFSLGSWAYTTGVITPNTTSAYTYTGYTIPLDVANQMAKSTGTMTATLYSYSDSNGSTQIGTATKTFTVTVPEDSTTKPSITMTLSPITHSQTGSDKFSTVYVQGRSKVQAAFSGSGKYGATISSYYMTINGVRYTSPYTTGFLSLQGDIEVVGTVTDSRGFTNTVTETIHFIPYSSPKILPLSGYKEVRCFRSSEDGAESDGGQFITVNGIRSYTEFTTSDGAYNTCSVRLRYRETGGTWTSEKDQDGFPVLLWTDTSTNNIDRTLGLDVLGTALDPKTSYEVELYIYDDFYIATTLSFYFPAEDIPLHLREGGKGAAIGKYSTTENLFECEYDGQFNHTVKAGQMGLIDTEIEIGGDADTYYPVHIRPTYFGNSQPAFLGIGKQIGTKSSASWSGNHSSGTSSLSIGWLFRYNGGDGNGLYAYPLYKAEDYAELIAHVEGMDNSAKGMVVWLRGGGATYRISCSVPATVTVHLETADISEQTGYTVEVDPRGYTGNKGIYYHGTAMVDIVVEEGTITTSDGIEWSYRKWHDGTAECWARRSLTVNLTTAWGSGGSLFYGVISGVKFPFTFVSPPVCHADTEYGTSEVSTFIASSGKTTTTSSQSLMLVRATSSSNAGVAVTYAVKGKI